jgi:hypothetical protein
MGAPRQPVQLFADPEEIDHAREVAAEKKVVLPEVIPGFKANSLELGEVFPCHCAFSFASSHCPPCFGKKGLTTAKGLLSFSFAQIKAVMTPAKGCLSSVHMPTRGHHIAISGCHHLHFVY